jgi:hypothetical protein
MNARAPCARVFVTREITYSDRRASREAARVHCLRARYELESSAQVPPLTAGELEIVLPVDYEILGKCIYIRKKQDGVRSPKSSPRPSPRRPPGNEALRRRYNIYLRKREESSLLVMNAPSVLIYTYVHKRKYLYQ